MAQLLRSLAGVALDEGAAEPRLGELWGGRAERVRAGKEGSSALYVKKTGRDAPPPQKNNDRDGVLHT